MNEHRQIVRLKTSHWHDSKGAYIRRSLTTLRRLSSGAQLLDEECSMVGAAKAFDRLVNLNESPDGIYEVVPCNETKDWETGYIDSYDLELVPFSPCIPLGG